MRDNFHDIKWPGWETVGVLGRGSFGAVYEIQRVLGGTVEKAALKVISIPQHSSDLDEMFADGQTMESVTTIIHSHMESVVAEYTVMRQMNGCANVVSCDDVRYVQHEDRIGWDIYIKMELLTPLTQSLDAEIEERTVLKIAKDLCNALVVCKQNNIVHRDIKPQNIFVSRYGDYKLGDFGVAKTMEKTTGGTKIGTYKYMAPEVYNNQPYSSTADIYSLGLVLYWLLNERRLPFLPLPPAMIGVGVDEDARLRRLKGEKFPKPAHGSEGLKAIVMKACEFNPKKRYQSACEMLDALNSLEGKKTGAVSRSTIVIGSDGATRGSAAECSAGTNGGTETYGPAFAPTEKKTATAKPNKDKEAPSGRKSKKKIPFIIVCAIALLVVFFVAARPTEEYEYSDSGVLVKYTEYGAFKKLERYAEYEHDSNGKLTKYTEYGGNGVIKEVGKMNGSGELVERIFYAADGTISEKTRYEYNSKGDIKRAIDTYPNGAVKSISTYEYDENGESTIKFFEPSGQEDYIVDVENNLVEKTY